MIHILESSCEPRPGKQVSEDILVQTLDLVAVVDGAGDPLGRTTADKSLGRVAAETIARTLEVMDVEWSPKQMVHEITTALRATWSDIDLPEVGPTLAASAVVLNARRREIWRVGDCGLMIDGTRYTKRYAAERLYSDVRSFVLGSIALGEDPVEAEKAADLVLRQLHRFQHHYQNEPTRRRFVFGVLDTSPVPARFVEVWKLDGHDHEVVLASDGYPSVEGTLAAAEANLFKWFDRDARGLRGRSAIAKEPGASGAFDDRTYVRIAVSARDGNTDTPAVG